MNNANIQVSYPSSIRCIMDRWFVCLFVSASNELKDVAFVEEMLMFRLFDGGAAAVVGLRENIILHCLCNMHKPHNSHIVNMPCRMLCTHFHVLLSLSLSLFARSRCLLFQAKKLIIDTKKKTGTKFFCFCCCCIFFSFISTLFTLGSCDNNGTFDVISDDISLRFVRRNQSLFGWNNNTFDNKEAHNKLKKFFNSTQYFFNMTHSAF